MIEKYINELLLTQDKVIVPNLGTFVASYSPARVSNDGSTIIPPHKEINFSIYIKEEDKNDDLMKAVIKGENVGYYDFNEKLLLFVEQVQQSIIDTGHYKIENLGTLIKDENNKIVLIQDEDQSFLADSFGLPALGMDFLNKTIESETSQVEINQIEREFDIERPNASYKEPIVKEQVGRQEVERESQESSHTASIKKEVLDKGNRRSDLAWWLAVIPLVFLFTFLIYLFTSPEAMQNFKAFWGSEKEVSADLTTQNEVDKENFSPIQDSSTLNQTENTLPTDNQATDNTNATNENKLEEKQKTTPATNTNDELTLGKYYLVYGSFSSKNGAEKAHKGLIDKGLNTKVLFLASKNMYRVVIGDFESHAEASTKKADLGGEFSQTWVLKAE